MGYRGERMKKLLLLTVVGACIAAGQEAVPTVVEGATHQFGNTYAGLYAAEGRPDGGNVTISAVAGGQDMSLADIIGNWNEADDERAYWGTVIMTGGTAKSVTASSSATGTAFADNIYLVGEGGEVTIDGVRYTHTEDISISRLYGATGNDLTGNHVDLYGTGIAVGRMDNVNTLAFHLTAETSDAILDLTLPLDLIDVSLNFTAPASFAALPLGTAITLISSPAAIYLSDEQLARTYTITDGDTTLATARLAYTEGRGLSLHLTPEPQTTTLALLTLAALLPRRRRK